MTLKQIRQQCRQKMNRAIRNTYKDADKIITQSFDQFYSMGDPQRPRTNTLPGAKHVDPPVTGGDYVFLKAGYEGNQISYSDGTFTGGEVLGATMTGTYGVVGDPIYDELAFENILEAAQKNFSSEFG